MRIGLAFLAALPLAACGAAEENALKAFRDQSVAGCVETSRQAAPPAMAGLNFQRLCSCATDRIMDGKRVADLARMRPGDPEQREAIEQCAAQMVPELAIPAGGAAKG